MDTRADTFLSQFLDNHRDTREHTVNVLGVDESLAFEALTADAADLLTALETHYCDTVFTTSLVALFLPSLIKDGEGVQFDLLHGRYPEAVRTLRVLAEKMARAFFIDAYARFFPDATDHPGTTNVDKLKWYESNERHLQGKDLTSLGAMVLIDAPVAELRAHFGLLWNRLHAMAHPSAAQIRSGFGESARHVFNHFDEPLARRLIADGSEVFAVIWGMVMFLFPAIVPDLAAQPGLFRHAPQARLWFPK